MWSMESAQAVVSHRVCWSGECGIETVAQRLPELLGLARGQGPVEFDTRAVSRIDSAGLQLVTALVLELRRQGRAIAFPDPSEAFVQAALLAGLGQVLGLNGAPR
jgi:ABC-type transporter Mla MlaB component